MEKERELSDIKAMESVIDTATKKRARRIEAFRDNHGIDLHDKIMDKANNAPTALIDIMNECEITSVRFERVVTSEAFNETSLFLYLSGTIMIGLRLEEIGVLSYHYTDADLMDRHHTYTVVNKQDLAGREISEEEGLMVFDYLSEIGYRLKDTDLMRYLVELPEEEK